MPAAVLRGGIVRSEAGAQWMQVWKGAPLRARSSFDEEAAAAEQDGDNDEDSEGVRRIPSWVRLCLPPWYRDYEKAKNRPKLHTFVRILGWPTWTVPTFGPFVEHVVVVDETMHFSTLLAYHSPVDGFIYRSMLLKVCKLFGFASKAELPHLKRTLPETISSLQDLATNAPNGGAWRNDVLTRRTCDYIQSAVRHATLPSIFYALAPFVPLSVLLYSQRVVRRRDILDVLQTAPEALCFEFSRQKLFPGLAGHEHVWPLDDDSAFLVQWLARVQWTGKTWRVDDPCALHVQPPIVGKIRNLIDPPSKGRLSEARIAAAAAASALAIAPPPPPVNAAAAWAASVNLASAFTRLWNITGSLSGRVASDASWMAATQHSRDLVFAYGNFAVDPPEAAPVEGEAEAPAAFNHFANAHPNMLPPQPHVSAIRFPTQERLELIWARALHRIMYSRSAASVHLVDVQYPAYESTHLKTLFDKHLPASGRSIVLAPTLSGTITLRRNGFPRAMALSDFVEHVEPLTASERKLPLTFCVLDQAHRLSLSDAVRLAEELGLANDVVDEAAEAPRLTLVLVGNSLAVSNAKGAVFRSMWSARERFTSATILWEPASETTTATGEDTTYKMRSGNPPCDSLIVEAPNLDALRLAIVQLEAKFPPNVRIQYYARNADKSKLLRGAMAPVRNELAVDSHVLLRDVGLVSPLRMAARESTFSPFVHESFHGLATLTAPRSTCTYFSVDHLSHKHCCADVAVSKLHVDSNAPHKIGRASAHSIVSAHVMLQRECPLKSVPYAVLYVCATTTRDDILYACSKVTKRLVLLAETRAHVLAAYDRASFTHATLDMTINGVFLVHDFQFPPTAPAVLLLPPPPKGGSKKAAPKRKLASVQLESPASKEKPAKRAQTSAPEPEPEPEPEPALPSRPPPSLLDPSDCFAFPGGP